MSDSLCKGQCHVIGVLLGPGQTPRLENHHPSDLPESGCVDVLQLGTESSSHPRLVGGAETQNWPVPHPRVVDNGRDVLAAEVYPEEQRVPGPHQTAA